VGSKAFGGLHRRLKEKTAESRWFETTGQAPFGRAKAAYWKINTLMIQRVLSEQDWRGRMTAEDFQQLLGNLSRKSFVPLREELHDV
jgi:hypothetical protein